jgi:thiamine-monophosphate kinase
MERQPKRRLSPRGYRRHFFPDPRLEIGRVLREKKLASAMIDVSDGISTDLSHICEESGVGAEIHAGLVPRARVGKPTREVDLDVALHGGEDYELLFTIPADKRVPAEIGDVRLTCIGQIARGREVFLRDAKGIRWKLEPRGWEHFRS